MVSEGTRAAIQRSRDAAQQRQQESARREANVKKRQQYLKAHFGYADGKQILAGAEQARKKYEQEKEVRIASLEERGFKTTAQRLREEREEQLGNIPSTEPDKEVKEDIKERQLIPEETEQEEVERLEKDVRAGKYAPPPTLFGQVAGLDNRTYDKFIPPKKIDSSPLFETMLKKTDVKQDDLKFGTEASIIGKTLGVTYIPTKEEIERRRLGGFFIEATEKPIETGVTALTYGGIGFGVGLGFKAALWGASKLPLGAKVVHTGIVAAGAYGGFRWGEDIVSDVYEGEKEVSVAEEYGSEGVKKKAYASRGETYADIFTEDIPTVIGLSFSEVLWERGKAKTEIVSKTTPTVEATFSDVPVKFIEPKGEIVALGRKGSIGFEQTFRTQTKQLFRKTKEFEVTVKLLEEPSQIVVLGKGKKVAGTGKGFLEVTYPTETIVSDVGFQVTGTSKLAKFETIVEPLAKISEKTKGAELYSGLKETPVKTRGIVDVAEFGKITGDVVLGKEVFGIGEVGIKAKGFKWVETVTGLDAGGYALGKKLRPVSQKSLAITREILVPYRKYKKQYVSIIEEPLFDFTPFGKKGKPKEIFTMQDIFKPSKVSTKPTTSTKQIIKTDPLEVSVVTTALGKSLQKASEGLVKGTLKTDVAVTKPIVFPIQITTDKIFQAEKIRQRTKTITDLKQMQKEEEEFNKRLFGAVRFKQIPRLGEPQKTKIVPVEAIIGKTRLGMGEWFVPPIITTPAKIPGGGFLLPPLFPSIAIKPSRGIFGKPLKQPRMRTPSLEASARNIFGKAPKKKRLYTGLEFRPLIKSKKKTRRGGLFDIRI